MRTRREALKGFAALGAGALLHCGARPARKLIAFSQCNNAEPYRAAQNAALTRLLAPYADLELAISDAQQDNSKQIAQIETFLRQKPELLIVAPNERAPLTAVMGKATDAGIRVICLERDVLQPNYTTYIRCDNRAIGRRAGQFIADELAKRRSNPEGNLVVLRGLLGVEGEINRHEGAMEVFAKYPGIKVVHEAVADWLQAKAKDRMTEALRAQPVIHAVYGHNDPMAIGAYLAARELGRDREMFFVGVDGLGGDAGGVKKVMDGVLAATFVYPLCVEKAVEVGLRMLREPEFRPEKTYVMDSKMVTRANAADVYRELS
jgi:ribose transport system substrate-binding protein